VLDLLNLEAIFRGPCVTRAHQKRHPRIGCVQPRPVRKLEPDELARRRAHAARINATRKIAFVAKPSSRDDRVWDAAADPDRLLA
jgi:hypothetical protein